MPIPDFTPEERYLIAYVKSRESMRTNFFMYAYLFIGLAWFAFGVAEDSGPMVFAGFGTFLVGRIYEEVYGARFTPTWRSLIEKFEAASADVPQSVSISLQQ